MVAAGEGPGAALCQTGRLVSPVAAVLQPSARPRRPAGRIPASRSREWAGQPRLSRDTLVLQEAAAPGALGSRLKRERNCEQALLLAWRCLRESGQGGDKIKDEKMVK